MKNENTITDQQALQSIKIAREVAEKIAMFLVEQDAKENEKVGAIAILLGMSAVHMCDVDGMKRLLAIAEATFFETSMKLALDEFKAGVDA